MAKMRVLFFGNHTVGVKALGAISKNAEICGVICHPPDIEDGTRYLSVFEYAVSNGWNAIRLSGRDARLPGFVEAAKPDLIWITDYKYILPQSILEVPKLGAVNLHPSLLPKYRGRAPINWAIINGETKLGLTAHFVDDGMDTGDIIEQVEYNLSYDQDVGDALNILYPLYEQLSEKVLAYFINGNVPRTPQNHSEATTYPARKPEDGLINWNQPAKNIFNLIRAVTKPYPGAFTYLNSTKIYIWKARMTGIINNTHSPGTITLQNSNKILVACVDEMLEIVDFSGLENIIKLDGLKFESNKN